MNSITAPHSFSEAEIRALALANGFTERLQPDGRMDLNAYVYTFARACFEAGQNSVDKNIPSNYSL